MDISKIDKFFNKFNELESEQLQQIIESHLDDNCIEQIIMNLEDLYGIEDDEELGSLCQILITGYLLGSNALDS